MCATPARLKRQSNELTSPMAQRPLEFGPENIASVYVTRPTPSHTATRRSEERMTESPLRSRSPSSIWRWVKFLFVAWLCLKVGRLLLDGDRTLGAASGGRLRMEAKSTFRARPVGRETEDRFNVDITRRRGPALLVDRIHAGFDYVTIKYTDNGDRAWVESDGKVGASIDLTTADFRSELDRQHPWGVNGIGYGARRRLDREYHMVDRPLVSDRVDPLQ